MTFIFLNSAFKYKKRWVREKMKKGITYIYETYMNNSFAIISRQHIKHLRRHVEVYEVSDEVLDYMMWSSGHNILIHPITYRLLGWDGYLRERGRKRLENVMRLSLMHI